MRRLIVLLALYAPGAMAAADLVITQQGEFSVADFGRSTAYTVGTDACEALSTNQVIVATAHAARVGDVLRFTTVGQNYFLELHVSSTTTNTITLTRTLPVACGIGDAFTIMRLITPAVASDGSTVISGTVTAPNASVGATGAAVPASATYAGGRGVDGFLHGLSTSNTGVLNVNSGGSSGGTPSLLYYHDFSGGSVDTTYTQISASLATAVNEFKVFECSGLLFALATGAAGFEVDFAYIPPGGTSAGIPVSVAAGQRLSFHTAGAGGTASTCFVAITGIK